MGREFEPPRGYLMMRELQKNIATLFLCIIFIPLSRNLKSHNLMKYKFTLFLLIAVRIAFTQSYLVTVNNGYGSGIFNVGDTVYVFAREESENEVFSHWETSPVLQVVKDEGEWRFAFVMPQENVSITAFFENLPNNFLQFEEIQGVNISKPVYSAIANNSKGTVFVFHGTSGSVNGWVGINKDQNYSILKDLYNNGYSVIVAECEESTLGTDLNSDGKIRWYTFPIDTINNIDYANMKAIIDTFENRGVLDRSKLFSLGMSAGGAFSTGFSVAFSTLASATYCASGQMAVMEATQSAILFCMMPNDEVIGQEGNDDAIENYNYLVDEGKCTDYFMNYPFPIYPEYFARVGLSLQQSQNVFNEILSNEFLDGNRFLTADASILQAHIQSNQSLWSNFLSLSGLQKVAVGNLIGVAYGSHEFYSNHNKRTIDFFDHLCETPNAITSQTDRNFSYTIFPNPASDMVYLMSDKLDYSVVVTNIKGQIVFANKNVQQIDVSKLSTGLYFIRVVSSDGAENFKLMVE